MTRAKRPARARREADGFDELAAELQRHFQIREYNEALLGYEISLNGLLPWRALILCVEQGVPVPDNLLRLFAQYGALLWKLAQQKGTRPADYARALQLPSGARELTAAQQALGALRRVRHVSEALALMHSRGIGAPQACAAVARNRPGVKASVLQKDVYTLRPRPAKTKAGLNESAPARAAGQPYRPPRR